VKCQQTTFNLEHSLVQISWKKKLEPKLFNQKMILRKLFKEEYYLNEKVVVCYKMEFLLSLKVSKKSAQGQQHKVNCSN